jgi:hypothetical protein
MNGEIIHVGETPQSMVDVAGAAWGVDNIPPSIRPSAKPTFKIEPETLVQAPREMEGPGGIVDRSATGRNILRICRWREMSSFPRRGTPR